MATAVTYTETVECAKVHIMNHLEMYSLLSDNVKNAKANLSDFTELVGTFLIAFDSFGWRDYFPTWAGVKHEHLFDAIDELVREWEE
jgi:hypothetical protein